MTEIKLKSGKKAVIKDLSCDSIDEINEVMQFVTLPDGSSTVVGVNKHRTAWFRGTLARLGDWKAKNGEVVPDEYLKTLTKQENTELFLKVQGVQVLNPKKPSNLG